MKDAVGAPIRVDEETKDSLVAKCQENGWLKRGGYDWQDDPYLEEYPYEFARIEDMEALRQTLGGGNWAIRQGFLYKDLAFIQQVNGGDEWWTLKKTGDGWLDFESWSFEGVAKDYHEFARAITSMHVATPEECKFLDYMRNYEDLMLPPKSWQASGLPEGWKWLEYDDGSGSLTAPDGEKSCTFDKQTREFTDVNGRYCIHEDFSFAKIEKQVAAKLAKQPMFHASALAEQAEAARRAAANLESRTLDEAKRNKDR